MQCSMHKCSSCHVKAKLYRRPKLHSHKWHVRSRRACPRRHHADDARQTQAGTPRCTVATVVTGLQQLQYTNCMVLALVALHYKMDGHCWPCQPVEHNSWCMTYRRTAPLRCLQPGRSPVTGDQCRPRSHAETPVVLTSHLLCQALGGTPGPHATAQAPNSRRICLACWPH